MCQLLIGSVLPKGLFSLEEQELKEGQRVVYNFFFNKANTSSRPLLFNDKVYTFHLAFPNIALVFVLVVLIEFGKIPIPLQLRFETLCLFGRISVWDSDS